MLHTGWYSQCLCQQAVSLQHVAGVLLHRFAASKSYAIVQLSFGMICIHHSAVQHVLQVQELPVESLTKLYCAASAVSVMMLSTTYSRRRSNMSVQFADVWLCVT